MPASFEAKGAVIAEFPGESRVEKTLFCGVSSQNRLKVSSELSHPSSQHIEPIRRFSQKKLMGLRQFDALRL
jgi:hypothetical protein